MANGITIKQAIDNELEGKDKVTLDDTVTCIKHIASGIDAALDMKTQVKKNTKRISKIYMLGVAFTILLSGSAGIYGLIKLIQLISEN